MAALEAKGLHKLHFYLGQTSLSKHVFDLEPQLPTRSSVFVDFIFRHNHTHTRMQTNDHF